MHAGRATQPQVVDVTIEQSSMFDSRIVVVCAFPIVPDKNYRYEKDQGGSDLLNDLGLGMLRVIHFFCPVNIPSTIDSHSLCRTCLHSYAIF